MGNVTAKDLVHDYENGVIDISDNQTRITRVFEVSSYSAWEDALGSGLPEKGDGHPMKSSAKVRGYKVIGLGKPSWNAILSAPDYEKAIVIVEYSTTGPSNGQVMLRKEEMDEVFEVSRGGVFNTSGNPVESPMNITISMERIIVPKIGLTADPVAAIWACRNRVNSSPWKPATDVSNYPAGTLLYKGTCRREQRWDEGVGIFVWDLEHVFVYNAVGWNYAWDPAANSGGGGFDLVVPARYPSAAFNGLLV